MTKRWIKQRNSYSCGPVALMNLLKWLGQPVNYDKDYPEMFAKCKCNKEGTQLRNFVKVLYEIEDIKITPRTVPNIWVIDEALSQNRAVILKTAYKENYELEGHFFLITEKTEKSFFCVNLASKHGWASKASFQTHWLQHYSYYCHECGIAPYAWIIRKI